MALVDLPFLGFAKVHNASKSVFVYSRILKTSTLDFLYLEFRLVLQPTRSFLHQSHYELKLCSSSISTIVHKGPLFIGKHLPCLTSNLFSRPSFLLKDLPKSRPQASSIFVFPFLFTTLTLQQSNPPPKLHGSFGDTQNVCSSRSCSNSAISDTSFSLRINLPRHYLSYHQLKARARHARMSAVQSSGSPAARMAPSPSNPSFYHDDQENRGDKPAFTQQVSLRVGHPV